MFPFANGAAPSRLTGGRNGTQAVLDLAPGLREAIEPVIVKVVKNLQTMAGTTTTIEGMLAGMALDQGKDVIASHGPDAAAALLDAPQIQGQMLMTLDATLVHAVVELLCGGNGAELPPNVGRAVTPIDIQFSQIVFTLVASALSTEWTDFGFAGTRATKIEGGLPVDCLGPRGAEVAVVKMTMGAFGLHGAMRLVLPLAALDRFQRPDEAGATGGVGDPSWSGSLHKEVGQAPVSLDAYLEAKGLTLATLANLKVGQILALPADTRDRVSLVCDGQVLFRGELGQEDDLYSLRIADIVVEPAKLRTIERRPQRSPLHDLFKA